MIWETLTMADTFETNVAVSAITVPAVRLRQLRPDAVSELAASIRETGLLQAISVRSTGAGRYALIFGRHRLEAVRRIGSATIRARILKGITDMVAEMQEIDENLVRADLSPAEHAMHIGRRKEIYEKQHPQTRAHVAGAHAANALMGNASAKLAPAFTADTAAKTGRSERVIQRHATRADHISNLADTVGTSLDTGEELDALARMPRDAQADVIRRAKAGNKVSARVELKKQARDTREWD